jgi:hypothetical protein
MDRIINYLISLVQSVLGWFEKLWDVFKSWVLDAIYSIFDSILSVFEALITGIPVPASWSAGGSVWSGLGSDAIWVANNLKLPLCITIIVAAWGIRFLLNLIPAAFTRV